MENKICIHILNNGMHVSVHVYAILLAKVTCIQQRNLADISAISVQLYFVISRPMPKCNVEIVCKCK